MVFRSLFSNRKHHFEQFPSVPLRYVCVFFSSFASAGGEERDRKCATGGMMGSDDRDRRRVRCAN